MAHVREIISVVGALAVSGLLILGASSVVAQESTIAYPIAELGGCESKDACRTYCDDLAHVTECVAFAESHGLMDADEAREARLFAGLGGKGPGGCTSKEACEAYCEDVTRINECLAFAETHGILDDEELEEARQVARALREGAKLPGGCTSKASCEAYCEDPAHMRQCLAFAKQAGFMDPDELAEAEKVAAFLESGGKMPGGCQGEKECRAYCENGDHMEECSAFAIKAGFMSEKEAEMFRKTGGKGPGGCRGRECEAYCEAEANREVCITFAMEHDLMSAEDKARMEEGKQKAQEALEKAPPEVLACIEKALGSDAFEKWKGGEYISPRLGEVLPKCFQEVMGNGSRGPFGPGSEATDCMRRVFGDDFEEKMKGGEFDPGARDSEIRDCMQKERGEGFLDDEGRWKRSEGGMPEGEGFREPPPMGGMQFEGSRGFEELCREHPEECATRRGEMEARMRAGMEGMMRDGTFDPSRLPPDFRPEGHFPPPESFTMPSEGTQMYMPPPGTTMPVETTAPQSRLEPVNLVAAVSTVFFSLFGF